MNIKLRTNRGFSMVKLLTLVGLVVLLMGLMFDSTHDSAIRNKVDQGLDMAEAAKKALLKTCNSKGDAVITSNRDAGFSFFESMYLAEVKVSGDCSSGDLEIAIRTQNTGAKTSPELVLFGDLDSLANSSGSDWNCALRKGEPDHVPEACRSRKPS